MDEEKTFNRLRRNSLDEMIKLISEVKKPPPVFNFGNTVFERADFYPEVAFYFENIALLNKHGWSVEDFYTEIERKAVLDMVREYNDSIGFPEQIIERAKRLFPNAKFTQAKIELE